MEETLKIPSKSNLKFGYLSNDSSYGFIENETYWPTVTHYVEAKKFEGTYYEEEIRKCPTASLARRKTKERETTIIRSLDVRREKVYGKTSTSKREDYKLLEYLMVAIHLKFEQHLKLQTLLLSTCTYTLLDSEEYKGSAQILTQLRDKLRIGNLASKLEDQKTTQIRDLLISLTIYISKIEGYNQIYNEMVDDAIFNVSSNFKFEDYPTQLENFRAKTHAALLKRNSRSDSKEVEQCAKKITQFVWWYIKTPKAVLECNEFKDVYNEAKKTYNFEKSSVEIVLPPIAREYRKISPQKMKFY